MTSLLERIELDKIKYCNNIHKEFSKKCFDKKLNIECGNLLSLLKTCKSNIKLKYKNSLENINK